jgi:hypothetical protein
VPHGVKVQVLSSPPNKNAQYCWAFLFGIYFSSLYKYVQMSFFKDLGDADSKHLATILLVPLLLLPGFQEKLFIENVPFAELDVLRLLAYAAVIGFTLLVVFGCGPLS